MKLILLFYVKIHTLYIIFTLSGRLLRKGDFHFINLSLYLIHFIIPFESPQNSLIYLLSRHTAVISESDIPAYDLIGLPVRAFHTFKLFYYKIKNYILFFENQLEIIAESFDNYGKNGLLN